MVLRLHSRWLLVLLPLLGCSSEPPPQVDTGARQAAAAFYEALIRRDWSSAYGLLDAGSRAICSEQQFAVRAKTYLQHLGFEPRGVQIQFCEEQETAALAHLALAGNDGKRHRRFREGVELRKAADGWAVVLPANFGRSKAH